MATTTAKPIFNSKMREQVNHDLSLSRSELPDHRDDEDRPLDVKIFRRLFSLTGKYAAKRNWLFVITMVRGAQLPALAWAIGAVINGPITNKDEHGALVGAGLYLALAAFTQLTMHFRSRLALELGEAVVRDLRNMVFEHLMRQPMSYFNRTRLGRTISRMTSDIEAMRNGVQNVLFITMVQICQMLGAAIFMLVANWKLFLVILLLAPVVRQIDKYFRRRIAESSRVVQESFSRITASLAESVKGIRVTQGFSREEINAGLFRRLVHDHSEYSLGFNKNVAILIPLLELNSQFFIASILFIGGYGALHWGFPPEDLVTFFFLANLFFQPIQSIAQQFTEASNAMAGAERVFSLLDTKPDWEDAPDAQDIGTLRGSVEFKHITFAYDPAKTVLHDINFKAEPGQSFALVGHTGSGKTSIINLISKFYLPTQGELLIDGVDIRKITQHSLHKQMGLVLQQNFLFSGTVMENIRLGKLSATDEEVIEAVRSLNCLDLIENMQDGFQTVVSERGSGLSQGQQQLVCFARAFLANPRILILDEATSSVDTMTEARLQDALATLMKGRTSFVIAHRLSTIRKADVVLVLDHGVIKERGNHAELLTMNGIYAGLYRQFAEA
jgi:ATP-binding cassette subfamily B protein